jgi:hypothetical protein
MPRINGRQHESHVNSGAAFEDASLSGLTARIGKPRIVGAAEAFTSPLKGHARVSTVQTG